MVIFHSYVSLPEGNQQYGMWDYLDKSDNDLTSRRNSEMMRIGLG